MDVSIKDKVAIITGSSNGIGKEIALEFARNGAKVVVNGRNKEAIKKTVEEIKTLGGQVIGIEADLRDRSEVQSLINGTISEFGKVDIIVNNAGDTSGTSKTLEISDEEWNQIIEGNLKSVFLTTQSILPFFQKQKYGKIINISSQAGRALSILAGAHYSSAKAGVIAFTRHIAKEFAQDGIYANVIAPGIINSGERFDSKWNQYPEDYTESVLSDIALKRLGKNSEIAKVAVFLASDDSSYITGASIDVNGGRWML
ncbi:MAG: SDR family NAD(P)-dependent oxidoreductase [Clostridiaceae bacterium]